MRTFRMRKYIIAIAFCMCLPILSMTSYGQSLDEAKRLFNEGEYQDAVETLTSAADKETKNTSLNHIAGVALQRLGRFQEAKKYLNRGTNESNINLAEISFMEYRFDEGDEFLDKYEKTLKKNKKTAQPSDEAVAVREKLERGRSMMDRVEKITIIDSIAVDKDDFLKAYKLASSAGSLKGSEVLPRGTSYAEPAVVYVTENGKHKIWSAPDKNENYVLVESELLDDGEWSTPTVLSNDLGEGGDANFPFQMSDGITLYFANDGENSLGGYDIFISRRDGDSFFQPQNLGMPYNSPYDDYMLAIDEETGSGWWATDRNQLEDKITIYRFIPSEFRINYPSDTEDLADKALARNYRSTQDGNTDYEAIIEKMDALTIKQSEPDKEFTLGLPNGKIYTSLRDFKTTEGRGLMTEYIGLERKLKQSESRLAELRKEYRKGRRNVGGEIETAESDIEAMRSQLKSLKNDIARSER